MWAWILGAIAFPSGPFICLGAAKALRWWAAIVLAVLAHGIHILMIRGMEEVQNTHGIVSMYVLLAGFLYIACVGQLQYSIGRRHGVWTDAGRRLWWLFGVLWIFIFALMCATLLFVLVLQYLRAGSM
jgi:hypothetical protein